MLLHTHGVSFFKRYLSHVVKSLFALVASLSEHILHDFFKLQVVDLVIQQIAWLQTCIISTPSFHFHFAIITILKNNHAQFFFEKLVF
jgi:hypothetical protein